MIESPLKALLNSPRQSTVINQNLAKVWFFTLPRQHCIIKNYLLLHTDTINTIATTNVDGTTDSHAHRPTGSHKLCENSVRLSLSHYTTKPYLTFRSLIVYTETAFQP